MSDHFARKNQGTLKKRGKFSCVIIFFPVWPLLTKSMIVLRETLLLFISKDFWRLSIKLQLRKGACFFPKGLLLGCSSEKVSDSYKGFGGGQSLSENICHSFVKTEPCWSHNIYYLYSLLDTAFWGNSGTLSEIEFKTQC